MKYDENGWAEMEHGWEDVYAAMHNAANAARLRREGKPLPWDSIEIDKNQIDFPRPTGEDNPGS